MTERERRLERLAALRNRQHDAAALDLRAARGALTAAEDLQRNAVHCATEAQQSLRLATGNGDRTAWLLGCADAEWARRFAMTCKAACETAAGAVATAALAEAGARREAMQIDSVVERVQHDRAQRMERLEQQRMDEFTRILRRSSSLQAFPARTS